jgi:predicted amidohydrolase YtcJ
MSLATGLIPAKTDAFRIKTLKTGMAVETAYGWTGVHFMSAPWADVEALEALAKAGQAPLRVYAAVDRDDAEKLFASGPRSVADGRVVTRMLKLYADGALGSRGAALFAPYSDKPETSGLMLLTPEDTRPILAHAVKAGLQVGTHAIGDRGDATVLDLYAEALPKTGPSLRWRIEHAQHIRPIDIPRLAKLGVIASMQPPHPPGQMGLPMEPTLTRMGEHRWQYAYAWQTLRDAGAVLVFASDWPVSPIAPLASISAAMTRQKWRSDLPDQRQSLENAIAAYTRDAAFAEFMDGQKGVLKAGLLADCVLVSGDMEAASPQAIADMSALVTVSDGKVTFEAA